MNKLYSPTRVLQFAPPAASLVANSALLRNTPHQFRRGHRTHTLNYVRPNEQKLIDTFYRDHCIETCNKVQKNEDENRRGR